MEANGKKLIVVGDRVLIEPESGSARTRLGLFLPPTAVEKMAVQGGRVADVGPGMPVPNPSEISEEPWKIQSEESRVRYIPIEAKVGDFALFLRNAAVEIELEGTKYLIVPHGAILLLVRENAVPGAAGPAFDEKDFRL